MVRLRDSAEADIKAETQATIRNIPFTQPAGDREKCLKCDAPATTHAWFAKSALIAINS